MVITLAIICDIPAKTSSSSFIHWEDIYLHPSLLWVSVNICSLRAKPGRQLEEIWFNYQAEMDMSHHDETHKLIEFVQF